MELGSVAREVMRLSMLSSQREEDDGDELKTEGAKFGVKVIKEEVVALGEFMETLEGEVEVDVNAETVLEVEMEVDTGDNPLCFPHPACF